MIIKLEITKYASMTNPGAVAVQVSELYAGSDEMGFVSGLVSAVENFSKDYINKTDKKEDSK